MKTVAKTADPTETDSLASLKPPSGDHLEPAHEILAAVSRDYTGLFNQYAPQYDKPALRDREIPGLRFSMNELKALSMFAEDIAAMTNPSARLNQEQRDELHEIFENYSDDMRDISGTALSAFKLQLAAWINTCTGS